MVTDKMVEAAIPLDDCPEGLFLFNGYLGFMTEYATLTKDGFRQRDAYVVESGEYFWGGTATAEARAKLLIQPINSENLTTALATVSAEPVAWQYRWKGVAGEWSDWITTDLDPNDWTWPHYWKDMEARPLYAAPQASAPMAVRREELSRYIDKCRELARNGEYSWWSRLAEILEATAIRSALVGGGEAREGRKFVKFTKVERPPLIIGDDAATPAPVDERVVEALPDDLFTHQNAWRTALEIARNNAEVTPPDVDDRSYWQHQLDVFDRVFAALKAQGAR